MLHVSEHILNSGELVGRLLPGKGRLELPVHLIRGGKGEPFGELAPGINFQQLPGQLLNIFTRLALRLFPGNPAQFVERRMASFGADIALHKAEPVHRKKQLVRAGVLQQEEVAATVPDADMLQPTVQGNTMIDVHHVIARLQFRKRGEKLFLAHLGNTTAPDPLAKQLFFGNQHQICIGKTETTGNIANEDGDPPPSQPPPAGGRCCTPSPSGGGLGRGESLRKTGFADGAGNLIW